MAHRPKACRSCERMRKRPGIHAQFPEQRPWGERSPVHLGPGCKAVYEVLKKLHAHWLDEERLSAAERQKALDTLGDKVASLLKVKESAGRMLLPVLAEATREALGSPRGVRMAAADKPSRPMTDQEKDALRRDVERWR
jgi:hypothetical protein